MTVEDWDSVNRFFSKRLSKQLIFNHIYPYTFECQPEYFLDDIKSYFLGYEKVLKIYQEDFTAHQFWIDMECFLRQEDCPNDGSRKRVPYRGGILEEKVLRRRFTLKNVIKGRICYIFNQQFLRYGPSFWNINPDSEDLIDACRTFFALFTPDERSDFIENWINEKATPRDRYIDKWARDTFEPDPYENSPVMDSFPDMADY